MTSAAELDKRALDALAARDWTLGDVGLAIMNGRAHGLRGREHEVIVVSRYSGLPIELAERVVKLAHKEGHVPK